MSTALRTLAVGPYPAFAYPIPVPINKIIFILVDKCFGEKFTLTCGDFSPIFIEF